MGFSFMSLGINLRKMPFLNLDIESFWKMEVGAEGITGIFNKSKHAVLEKLI